MRKTRGKRAPLDGTTRDIDHRGQAIVQTSEGLYFVQGALPDENVRIQPSRAKGKVRRAELQQVLAPHEHRITPRCPVWDQCGGCPLMNADAILQAEIKRKLLQNALPICDGQDTPEVFWVASDSDWRYRSRVRLHWDSGRIGYHARHQKTIVMPSECAVLDPTVEEAWNLMRQELVDLKGLGEILLMTSKPNEVTAHLRSGDPQPLSVYESCQRLSEKPLFAGLVFDTEEGGAPASWGQKVGCHHGYDGRWLQHPIDGFRQANTPVSAAMVRCVLDIVRQDKHSRVLELYAGSGNFTVAIAAHCDKLTAVEISENASKACALNLKERGLNASLRIADAVDYPRGKYDVAVLDPPRSGAADALTRLSTDGVRRIVNVSCDPATLKRDLQILSAAGYKLERAVAFDMFPQTAHVEAVVLMVR